MENNQIRQIIQSEIQKSTLKNVYDVSPIPVHSHDGIGSPQVNPNDLINASLYFAVQQTVLSSTQIKSLHTTPITLVGAQGIGNVTAAMINTVLIVEGITAKIYAGSTAFTGANNLEFRYTDGSGIKVTADMANTFINTTANTIAYDHVAGIVTEFAPVAHAPIVVCVPTANPGTGNGKIIISVKYRTVSL